MKVLFSKMDNMQIDVQRKILMSCSRLFKNVHNDKKWVCHQCTEVYIMWHHTLVISYVQLQKHFQLWIKNDLYTKYNFTSLDKCKKKTCTHIQLIL